MSIENDIARNITDPELTFRIEKKQPGSTLKKLIKEGLQEESGSTKDIGKNIPVKNKIYSVRDFLNIAYPNVEPLIGEKNNALLVPGEGMFFPGTGGVGKTLYMNSLAVSLSIGESVLKWRVPRALRVLIYQAELPPQFYQQRLKALYDSYFIANPEKAKLLSENIFVVDLKNIFNIAADNDTASQVVGEDVKSLCADVIILDPFLSFYRGNENDNNEVRRALDNFKRNVAEKHQCGIIITDHQPKYSGSDKNPEQLSSMRGAGAKRDWAASVIALNKAKTPEGQHGTFIKATVDKMRYGKLPRDPFLLRRDDFSFRHQLYREDEVELPDIAKVLDDAGGGLSKKEYTKQVSETFSLGVHDARKLIDNAIEEKWIVAGNGGNRSIIHELAERYINSRPEQKQV